MIQNLLVPEEQTAITRIAVQRLHNLGNYESVRYEITVDVAKSDDAGEVLAKVETILDDLQTTPKISEHTYKRAIRILGLRRSELTDADVAALPEMRDVVAEYESGFARRAAARELLSNFSHTVKHREVKFDFVED